MEVNSDGLYDAALGNILVMETLLSTSGSQGTGVSVVPPALSYEADCDAVFTDAGAFTTSVARFLEEATQLAKLNDILEEGNKYANMLYTWRSCSLAIPVIKSHNQENRIEIYEKTVEVLQPEVDKLKQLMDFKRRAINQFTSEVERLCRDRTKFVSETFLFTLGKLINVFVHLDELKNMKASVKNDYATYKRAAEILKKFSEPRLMEESQQLSMFLATHNVLVTTVKDSVQRIAAYEDLLSDIIVVSMRYYENQLYVTPAEKHAAVKVMGFCLYLIDSPTVNINKLESKKKIMIGKLDKIFKQLEIVPLLGDMVTSPFRYVEKTPNYDSSRWPLCSAPMSIQTAVQTHLTRHMGSLRMQHAQLIGQLTLLCEARQRVNAATLAKKMQKSREDADAEAEQLSNIALAALHHLSICTSSITEMFSWKLMNPVDRYRNPDCPDDAEEFEKVTRYNYTPVEKFAMVETIAMIKGLVAILRRMETELHSAVYRYIYTTVQRFVQCNLREPLRKAAKHRKDVICSILTGIRDICTDFADGVDPSNDPLLKGKKDIASGFSVQLPRKQVATSSTQLYLLRTMLEALISKTGASKKLLRNDLDPVHIEAIERFLYASFFWPYLIHFSKSLEQCSDLSQLWYREFYLEMTMGKRIQFPIDMSMPWILTNYILDTKDPTLMESCLYPLDLYNDAGDCALNKFAKQFLYEEVEAEVNLCFDQLIYKLSEQIFEHYKCLASCIYLNCDLQSACQKCGVILPKMPEARYEALLQKHHVQLLGHDIDLKRRLTQSMETFMLKSLDVVISRFETSDITAIVELEGLLAVNRLAHRLLQRHLALREFDELFAEANHCVTAPYGRITLYLFIELNYNFLPQYCYNMATDRFVKTIFPFVDPVERDKPPAAAHYHIWGSRTLSLCYTTLYSRYSNFVGRPHFEAMTRLLNYLDISVIFNELLTVIKNVINEVLLPYLKTLKAVMPKRLIMPRYEYGSPGVLSYYQAQLNDVMMYSDLQPKVFQCMREIGNAILFFRLLEQVLSQKEVTELCHSAMFQNMIPKPYVPRKDEGEGHASDAKVQQEEREKQLQEMMRKLRHKYRNQHLVPVISKLGSPQQVSYVKEASLLTRERLCFGLSLFKRVLIKIGTFLSSDALWRGDENEPTHGLNAEAEPQFHRLWSSLQFVFCMPSRSNEYTVEQLFGEGLNWTGCTLIRLLQQQRCFEVTDFCYHLQKIQRVDQKLDVVSGVSLKRMVERIRKFQILNDQIFAMVNVHLNSRDEEVVVVRHLEPPGADSVQPLDNVVAETEA